MYLIRTATTLRPSSGRGKSYGDHLHMKNRICIGLVGDYDETVPAHQAIPIALQKAAERTGILVTPDWVGTDSITATEVLAGYDGLWCVPATPYRDMAGALRAIKHAREHGVPFLGTCGGFQHAVVEYARNVLGWADAEHGESAPEAERAVVSELECALVEVARPVRLFPGTQVAQAYGADETVEGYRCRYGINPEFLTSLISGPLRPSADDGAGDIRAIELEGHPFFVATLFQPERAALEGATPPLAVSFVKACAQ